MVGDDAVPGARMVATRSIDLASSPGDVFPWLVQMGFGRAGWYSHDLLDNLGRRSAVRIVPEWQGLAEGDTVPGGPVSFRAVVVRAPREFVIVLDTRGRIGRRGVWSRHPAHRQQNGYPWWPDGGRKRGQLSCHTQTRDSAPRGVSISDSSTR